MFRKIGSFFLILLAGLVIYTVANAESLCKKYVYPENYSEYVSKYSKKNKIDKYFVYAIIKTESNFDSSAESDVGARGLMQLMNDAFDWVKFKMGDESKISFDDMYEAEYNIKYGTYLISSLYDEYGDKETALAAYFSGRGCVNEWLKNKEYSSNGKTLKKIPSAATEHYVNKVMTAYNGYTNLYKNKKGTDKDGKREVGSANSKG